MVKHSETGGRDFSDGPDVARRAHHSALGWLLALAVLLLLHGLALVGDTATVVLMAVTGLAHSTLGFVQHGGARVTPPGVFLIGMGLFGFFPTLYYADMWGYQTAKYELLGLTLLLGTQVLMYAYWVRREPGPLDVAPVGVPTSVWFKGVVLGCLALVAGVGISYLDPAALRPLARPSGYAGTVLVTVSLVQSGRRLRLLTLLPIAGLFAVFVMLLFTGGGRLVLGSLALALTMAVGLRWRPRIVKPAAIAALVSGTIILADVRADSVANHLTGYQESGLESVVWPQRRFFDMLENVLGDNLELGFGDTFLAALVAWVPRELWMDKPVGFGTTLTELYRPELLSVGHSEAALVHGEFAYNFALPGLAVLVLAVGWFVGWLDAWLLKLHKGTPESVHGLISRSVCLIATAGLLDLVWVGTYTYVERAGFASAVLALIYLLTAAPRTQFDPSPNTRKAKAVRRSPPRSERLDAGLPR